MSDHMEAIVSANLGERDRNGIVGRGVVDNDGDKVLKRLRFQALDCVANEAGFVETRHDHGDERIVIGSLHVESKPIERHDLTGTHLRTRWGLGCAALQSTEALTERSDLVLEGLVS